MTNKIDISKSIPRERWGEFFDQFSDGNRGRHTSIEIISPELGDEALIQDAPLLGLIYDRLGKGNDLVIEVDRHETTYGHVVNSPTEVLTGQNLEGQVVAISIANAVGVKTLVKLQAN